MKNFFDRYLYNSIALCVVLSITINIIIESVSRKSLWESLDYFINSPMTFFYNTFLIFCTYSIVYLVKRRIFVYVVVSIFWLAIGITNGIILSFRMTPFTVTDLALLESGISIIPNYLSTSEIILAVSVAILIITALILVFIFMPKHKRKIKYTKSIFGIFVLGITLWGFTNIAISQNWVSTHFGNLGYAYRDYGLPYCFMNTWLNTGISAQPDYSREKILSIFTPEELEELESIPVSSISTNDTNERKPNVVMLQMESFFDPTLLEKTKYSTDPIPNFRKLKNEYSSGFLTVPSVGAGTANTEFEVLSGMRVRFFGPGEYPYKSILKDKTCETIAYNLKRLGYGTHVIHNHRGAFYGRNNVLANLGFDTFTSLEYMNGVIKTPKNWAKDGVLKEEILTAFQSTESEDLVYTISVQGHGKYPSSRIFDDPVVTVDEIGIEEDALAFEYYIQQLYEMDVFIGELVAALEQFEEDTVLVIFGDHLPSLNISANDLVNKNIYETEYIIWDNFGLSKEDKDLFAYQLSAEVLNRINIHEGILTKYHQNHSQDLDYLVNLKALQYDMLYGKGYIFDGICPYEPTDLQMGIREIKVEAVVEVGNEYYIKGTNFTPYSKISIDDRVLDTIFLGPSVLGLLEEVKPEDVYKMKVSQVEKNKEILSTSE